MNKHLQLTFAFLFIYFISTWNNISFSQIVPEDAKARELFETGRKLLQTKNYEEAAKMFELSLKQKVNTLTSINVYYAGLSYYYAGQSIKARDKFNLLLDKFPQSRYLDEAKYHKGLIFLSDTASIEYGLRQLMELAASTTNKNLSLYCKDAITNYLYFEATDTFLKYYIKVVKPEYKVRTLEAICYRYIEQGDCQSVVSRIDAYYESGAQVNQSLSMIRERCAAKINTTVPSPEYRVALILPFMAGTLPDSLIDLPAKSLMPLEFFEGFQLGIKDKNTYLKEKLIVKVFDTFRDTGRLKLILDTDLKAFSPDIVIGPIHNAEAKILSDWAEASGIPLIVPYSPENYLIENKKNVFLASPSLSLQAKDIALYAAEQLKPKKIVIFSSENRLNKQFVHQFTKTADEKGLVYIVKTFPSNRESAVAAIPKIISELKGQGFDAYFLPTDDVEIAGMIMGQLKYYGLKGTILGTSDYRYFEIIDKEIIEGFKTTFTDVTHESNDTAAYKKLETAYLEQYDTQLTANVVKGYDIAGWLFSLLKYPGEFENLSDKIRKMPVYHGVFQNIYFNSYQENRSVQILRAWNNMFDRLYLFE